MDEASDFGTKSQLSTLIHYIKMDGHNEERFFEFHNINENLTVLFMSPCV